MTSKEAIDIFRDKVWSVEQAKLGMVSRDLIKSRDCKKLSKNNNNQIKSINHESTKG